MRRLCGCSATGGPGHHLSSSSWAGRDEAHRTGPAPKAAGPVEPGHSDLTTRLDRVTEATGKAVRGARKQERGALDLCSQNVPSFRRRADSPGAQRRLWLGFGQRGAGGAGRASETRLRGRISEVQGGDDSGFGEKPGQFQMLWTQRWPASPGGSRGLKVVVELRVDGEVWEPLVRCMTEQKRRHGSAKKGLAQGWSLPGPGALRGTGPHTEVRLPRAREARCARASVHTHWLTLDTCFVWSLGFRSPSGGRCPGDRPPGETVRRLDACPV